AALPVAAAMSDNALTSGVAKPRGIRTRSRRAIGYVRVSTAEQAEHGNGLAAQRVAIRQHAKSAGLRLVDVLADEGLSGSNGLEARVGLVDALTRLERGDADVLIVSRLDRLARDLLVQETVLERLRQKGVRGRIGRRARRDQ